MFIMHYQLGYAQAGLAVTFAYTPKWKKMNQVLFEVKNLKKIWGGTPNYTGFACKTGS